MVLLTTTPAAKAAVEEYCRLSRELNESEADGVHEQFQRLSNIETGDPIDHHDLVEISKFLVNRVHKEDEGAVVKRWRLDSLLLGAIVHRPPRPSKPEPTTEYKQLMQRLRKDEEQQQYERMINPAPPMETFSHRFPSAASSVGPIGTATNEVDEVTFADVNRQVALIINVLVSIICCSVFIWIAARRWDVPQRLGLSMTGSGVVAVAEVAIYLGYIKRMQDAKVTEGKKVERKEIMETWVFDSKDEAENSKRDENLRYRKGKHR